MSADAPRPLVPDAAGTGLDAAHLATSVTAAPPPTAAEARLARLIPDRDSVRRRVFSSLMRAVVHGGESL